MSLLPERPMAAARHHGTYVLAALAGVTAFVLLESVTGMELTATIGGTDAAGMYIAGVYYKILGVLAYEYYRRKQGEAGDLRAGGLAALFTEFMLVAVLLLAAAGAALRLKGSSGEP